MKALRRFTVQTSLPPALQPLGELVMNLRWSWHPETQDVFRAVAPDIWDSVSGDPLKLLGKVESARIAELAEDDDFLEQLRAAYDDLQRYLTEPRWYQSLTDAPRQIAYFSPEYGITEVLPQYSGGLGILAGDHLKTASDLGVPIVGVGLLYRRGYFTQSLSADGWQQEQYPALDPYGLPLTQLPIKVTVGLPEGRRLAAQVWRAQVGRVPLLLLDSDIEDNASAERDVTDRLYGGGSDHRLLQEMLLGIGGVRALYAYGADPEVFHTNEGHAGFLSLERIRKLTEEQGLDFDTALAAVRSGTVFTTHTPVPAGIDRFQVELVQSHFGGDNACPGVPVERILELGREPGGDGSVFNMAVMGLRLAQRANGVSRLHGAVSRGMFAGLWPGVEGPEVPISHVTNGVHAPTWVAREIFEIAARDIGPQMTDHARGWESIENVSDHDIWWTRRTLRARLVEDVRRRLRASWHTRGATESELGWVDSAFDPDVLTVGFARRVPSYKRLTLMLRDPDRLRALLLDSERPLQFVVAGKAHPADDGGKALIQQIVHFADDAAVRHRIAFLPDYDMSMAKYLYPGCDVWLNNPLRPLEACGTSGMKSALNGGLNLSIRDGWWDELYDGENGWAIPSADALQDHNRRDDLESRAIYDLLENAVLPKFYDRSDDGIPYRWTSMVRHTLQSLGPAVLASRMLRDYVHGLYLPAALASRTLSADAYAGAKTLAQWRNGVTHAWPHVSVQHVEATGFGDTPVVGATLHLRAVVALAGLRPDDVVVQAASGRVASDDELAPADVTPMALTGDHGDGTFAFEADIALARPGPFGYTVRVLPVHPLLASATEMGLVATAT